MSGTRSPSPTEPATERWSNRRLALVLYPFAAAAVAINVFLLGLLGQAIGLSSLSPMASLGIGVVLGVPAGWWTARWVRSLMDEADER